MDGNSSPRPSALDWLDRLAPLLSSAFGLERKPLRSGVTCDGPAKMSN